MKNISSKINQSRKKSFTLIEVVVSLAIIMLVLGALVGIAALSIKSYGSAAKRLQAINLARDGIEHVRQVRDSARLGSTGACYSVPPAGGTGVPNCIYVNSSGCTYPGISWVAGGCGTGGSMTLAQIFRIDSNGVTEVGINTIGTLGLDDFGRYMYLTDACSELQPAEAAGCDKLYRLNVTVWWKENNQFKNTSIDSYISKW